MEKKYKIAVSGAAEIDHCCKNIKELSREVGREINRQGCVLITGATTGAPYYAAQGCNEKKGISIGFSPAASEKAHKKVYRLPSDQFDVTVYTGFDYSGRNLLMTRAADGVIIVCGRMGTLNEFTIAYEDRKPIGVLTGSGGTADIIKDLLSNPHRKSARVVYDSDPKKLVEKLIKIIKKEKGR
jgi:uncharacterized protein (TIGR00725 family)